MVNLWANSVVGLQLSAAEMALSRALEQVLTTTGCQAPGDSDPCLGGQDAYVGPGLLDLAILEELGQGKVVQREQRLQLEVRHFSAPKAAAQIQDRASARQERTSPVCIKESIKGGKGVFAARDIQKGEIIGRRTGWIIPSKILPYLPRWIREHSFPLSFERHMLPSKFFMYINHSCDPNTGIANNKDQIAMRDIKKDEEITYDYSMISVEGWYMQCNCGSPNCRRIIRDYQFLDAELKRRYADYVPDWIKKRFG